MSLKKSSLSVSHYIPVSHLNTASIFETKNGDLGSVLSLTGTPFDLASDHSLKQSQNLLAKSISGLPPGFAVTYTQHRFRETPKESHHQTKQILARKFHEDYQANLKQNSAYRYRQYLTLMHRGKIASLPTLSHGAQKKLSNLQRAQHMDHLRKVRGQLHSGLSAFSPRVLSKKHTRFGLIAEPLSVFSLIVNGEYRRLRFPYQDIAQYIPAKRILVGDSAIEWQGNTQEEQKFGAILSVKHYAPQTQPVLLPGLLAADFEYVATNTFVVEDNSKVLSEIKRRRGQFLAVDDPGYSQQQGLQKAADQLINSELIFGYHHHTLMVLSDSPEALEIAVGQASTIYQQMQIVAVRETLNLEACFWAQLPGNYQYITRRALITNQNFSDFCQCYDLYSGHTQSHLGSPITTVLTPYRTLLNINFHLGRAAGEAGKISQGHTTIIAPTGSGKTTLMTFLDCQSAHLGGKRFFFDRDRGCELYVRAMGGQYACIHSGKSTGFNPFQLPDFPKNRLFLSDLLQHMVQINGRQVLADDVDEIAQVIDQLYALPASDRHLRHVLSLVSPQGGLLPVLQHWICQNDQENLGYLFDNPVESFDFSKNIMGFDLTELLDKQPSAVRIPVLMYIFHRMEAQFDGQLVGLYLDEGWQYLNDPYWAQRLKSALPTWRKKNVYVVMATQSPDSVIHSPVRDVLVQNTATHFYLPNVKARAADYQGHFKLTDKEYAFICHDHQSPYEFLYKQGNQSATACFDLTGLDDYLFLFSANEQRLQVFDQVIAEVGKQPHQWVPRFLEQMREKNA